MSCPSGSQVSALLYQFDPYELDEDNLSLSRDGRRIALEPRALRVLLLMVKNPDKLLTKTAILESVWEHVVVEESTLSRAVTLLRKQLGDDARKPTFIETVPTLGYRFIAPVNTASLPGAAPAPPQAPRPTPAPAVLSRHKTRTLWLVAAGLILVAAAVAYQIERHRQPFLAGKRTLVLSDFDNATGDAVFDDTLRQGMAVQLEQSPVLELLSDRDIQKALRLMGQRPDARLTPTLGLEICQRTGSAAVLEGSIATLGSEYVLGLHATNCNTGKVLDAEQVEAASKEDVLHALTQIASRFRTRIGESLKSVTALDTPLDEATTPSLAALKAYSQGTRTLSRAGSTAAIPLLRRAVELDPEFAIAHATLGRVYADVGQEMGSAASTADAYRHRAHASERERFFIVASYQMQVTGNLQQAADTCDTWRSVYPRDDGPLGFPAGIILRVLGHYEPAADRAQQLTQLDPDFSMGYHLLIVNDIALGRLQEARRTLDAATTRGLDMPLFALDRYRLAFLAADEAEMARLETAASTHPGTEDFFAAQAASRLAYTGHLAQARDVLRRAATAAEQLGRHEPAARLDALAAQREALFDTPDEAIRHAKAALALSSGRDVEYGAALAFAQAGAIADATALAQDLESRLPEDTSVRFHYLPAIRAAAALARHDPATAIDELRPNGPYELGTPPSAFSAYYGILYTVYLRGQAYLAAHRGAEAVTEFRKILDHRTLVGSDPIGAMAHLELARAYAMAKDDARSKSEYATFLSLWQAADADASALKDATAEFGRLQ